MIQEFKDFINRGNVVDLAVGEQRQGGGCDCWWRYCAATRRRRRWLRRGLSRRLIHLFFRTNESIEIERGHLFGRRRRFEVAQFEIGERDARTLR